MQYVLESLVGLGLSSGHKLQLLHVGLLSTGINVFAKLHLKQQYPSSLSATVKHSAFR